MTQATFVVPSWHYWDDPEKLQPYWELYYATVVREAFREKGVDFKIDLYDLRGKSGKELPEVIRTIPKRDVYLYWIFKSGDAMEAYSTAKILREAYPGSKHIAGGTHVDMCTEECSRFFDAVVVGPGEKSFVEAIEAVRVKGDLKKVYQQKYNEMPFQETPYPDRSFLPDHKIVNDRSFKQYGGAPASMVYFSRGCVYSCSYCVYNVPNMLQVRSPAMMRAELDYLKERYKIEAVLLKDEVAVHPNKKISAAMFEVLGESGLVWRGQTTTHATREQLQAAAESGCKELAVGVETVDDNVMEIINKKWQSKEKIRLFIDNCKEAGIKVKICFILGLPGEPADIVEKTIHFLEEAQPDFVSLSGFCPIPGSPIFRDPKKYGIRYIDHDWSKHAHLLYRFSDEEEVGLPFEYEENTPWGKSFTRDQIRENVQKVQHWLDQRAMIY